MTDQKHIVICLDGTWQNPYKVRLRDDGSRVLKPSNVLKLSRAVLPADPDDGRPQITCYDSGLGALVSYPGRPNRLLSLADRVLGGGWGAGFEGNVEEAFRFLALNFRPGDRLFVFGFSRGAAEARALSRFLDWLGGVPAKGDAYFAPLYFLHWVTTRGAGDPAEVTTSDGERPRKPLTPATIELLGVWDTVMALGSRFHATRRTSTAGRTFYLGDSPAACVAHARQALAVDERRFDFRPEIWAGAADHQSLEQRWFPGSHSNVGGGYVHDGLANLSLRWMLDEAEALGLAIDRDFIKHYRPYPQARLYPSGGPFYAAMELVRLRLGRGRRALIGHPAGANLTLDRSVIHRLRSDPAEHDQLDRYRPENVIELLAVQQDLDGYLAGLGLEPDARTLPADVMRAVEAHRGPS